jgi:hypothetical protein
MGIFSWLRPSRSAGQPDEPDEPSQPRRRRGRHSLIRNNYENPKLARVESLNGSAACAIAVEGPPSGAFNCMKAKDKRSIPTSASNKLLAIRDGSPAVENAGSAVM